MRNPLALEAILVLLVVATTTDLQATGSSVPANGQSPENRDTEPVRIDEGASGAEIELTSAERSRLTAFEEQAIQQFTSADLADYLALRHKAVVSESGRLTLHPARQAAEVARRTYGQPFRLNAVQFDLGEGDCVSCVNRQLALAVAWDWQSYVILIERIRHKDGIVEYKNRNFFTLQDWLPNNTAWLLDDITGHIGPQSDRPAVRFTYPVRPKLFDERPAAPGSKFLRVTFKGWDRSSGMTEVHPSLHVPAERVHQVMPDLNDGDVVLVLRKAPEGHLDCDHMGMIVRGEHDVVELAHSVPPHAVREPLTSLLARCPWIVGLKFLRLRENAQEIASQEVARLAPTVPVLSPEAQDARNVKWRASRAESAGK